MKKGKHLKEITLVAVLLIFAVSLFVVFGLVEKIIDRVNAPEDAPEYSDSGDDRVLYNDRWYDRNEEIETVLVLGIDTMETPDGSLDHSAQADFVALLVIDNEKKAFRILHINRDTMTDITQIDASGKEYGVFEAQLALAHTYGSPGRMQCRNTVSAVENLLYGVFIDHYLSMTMDAVPVLNDSVGGVPVMLSEDYPALGEAFVQGAEITLQGKQALSFVRWRSGDAESGNLDRMARQRQYITSLFDRYVSMSVENTLETMMKVNEYLVSDCTVSQISTLLERLQTYTYEETLTLAGEATIGTTYVEYRIDEAAAQAAVIDLFYVPDSSEE